MVWVPHVMGGLGPLCLNTVFAKGNRALVVTAGIAGACAMDTTLDLVSIVSVTVWRAGLVRTCLVGP